MATVVELADTTDLKSVASNSILVRSQTVALPLCIWCNKKKVKRIRNKCCSESCSSQKRCADLKKAGRLKYFFYKAEAARKTRVAKNMEVMFRSLCKELDIVPSPQIKKLFVEARNAGYHAGYYTGQRRGVR